MLDSVPADWQKVTLADLTKIVGGTTPKRNVEEYWENGEICWATPTDITALPKSCYELHDTKEKISTSAVEEGGVKILPKDTVIMTSRATIGHVAIARVEMATNQGFANFLPSSSYVPKFLCYFLESRRVELIANSGGSTFKELSKASLKRLFVLLPPLAEQQRIAEILTSVDDSIRATEAVIAQAERVKRGLMEDLLTGGLGSAAIARGEVPNGWAVWRLGDLSEFQNGYAFKPADWGAVGRPIIRIQNLNGGGDFNFYEGEIDKRFSVRSGDLLFCWSGSRGTSFGARYWHGDTGWLNQHIFKCIPKSGITKDYLFYLLDLMTEQIERDAHGGAGLVHIKKSEMVKFRNAVPTLVQQKEIVAVLDTIRDQLACNRKMLDELAIIKRGLMDDLLTGRVRTV